MEQTNKLLYYQVLYGLLRQSATLHIMHLSSCIKVDNNLNEYKN